MSGLSRRIFFNTFGCKTNQYDSALLKQSVEEEGFVITEDFSSADWVVVNTCAVTRRGEDKACQWVRRVGREHPGAKIAVVGCSVEVSAGRFSRLPGVRLLLGTEEKFRLGRILTGLDETGPGYQVEPACQSGLASRLERYPSTPVLRAHVGRARAFVKIQDGCDNRCTYCIVPFARGPSRSRLPDEIVREVKTLEEAGHCEAVLTGIHIGRYGSDLPRPLALASLVEKLLNQTSAIRFRLSSLEVGELDQRLLELLSGERRLCRHLHIPLQHGSAGVLRRMGRTYTPQHYREAIDKVTGRIHSPGLGTDIIVGFPGETREEFEECFNFIASLPFTYMHIFPYSPRPGTQAAEFDNRIPKNILRERIKVLHEVSDRKKNSFLEGLAGSRLRVIGESRLGSGIAVCRADNYVRVYCRECPLSGGFFDLVAENPWRDGVWGSLPHEGASAQDR
ncbi:MAG TPA: tRNA (N(6)-L-threonylcarbamoyladenosine(37)-C(2))-methylthiotransferase MtaB [archaeon]|nr:tRNA (N(6)-L-threonylcarbamoyladenosine(37)-C(2))-methylthiotransferase MtaB [archaeon]